MKRAQNRAMRLNRLKERIEGRPSTVVDLARELGVGRRTVERDLEDLKLEGGIDLRSENGKHWIRTKPSSLNDVEALAVYSAARLLQHTRIGDRYYRDAMQKLAKMVGEPARSQLMAGIERQRPSRQGGTFEKVARAWFERRVFRCDYRSASGEVKRRELKVYFIEVNRGNLATYAVAADRLGRDEPGSWKLTRMDNVHLLDEQYEIPDDVDLASILEKTGGVVIGERVEVIVRVTPSAASAFEEVDESILVSRERQADGGLVATVHGALDNRGRALELVPFLLGWGASIEVLEPASIREEVAEKLATAAEQYVRR